MCILYFDIGNTHTQVAVEKRGQQQAVYSLPTVERQTADQIGFMLLEILRHNAIAPEEITACVGSSVAPGMTTLVREACLKYTGKPLLLAPEDIPIPLENKYARPHEVGADILVGAFAARTKFPEAASLIVADYGTATTFACVTGNTFLGGLICPGVMSSLNALSANTAKLPKISLEVTTRTPEPGTSTTTCLNHGFVFGFAAMSEGVCKKLGENMPKPLYIIGTGGFSSMLTQVTDCFHAVEPNLLLEGLRLLYHNHTTSPKSALTGKESL